ncbi:four-carbon acid sugar kinase family protein [Anaerofilum sp. BX8]|uniref:Four-carbon acid sugar kinase family protein n=1 Tax=Anaerofilum hominis TaxID=2763016 RepID=A0A923I887_9FIRM|nr:four-carbon acid sugar kinase family protein [Anaerofilum hominis]MBC5580934.1 four-carbon acid sugar kinase family protein [Anaerofilum hominis]
MPFLGVAADDLTGATTAGVLLARSGARATVFYDGQSQLGEEGERADAVLISTSSRSLRREQAYFQAAQATRALREARAQYFSKRIDTTLRGQIGAELDAMLDMLGDSTVAIVVPAMPQSRRILVGGYSVIDGVVLSQTPVAQDVLTPVREAYVPDLLQEQSKRKVGLVPLKSVLTGPEETAEALRSQRARGCEILVVDAVTLEDIGTVARACADLQWRILSADPGPFTVQLMRCRSLLGEERSVPIRPAAILGQAAPGQAVLVAAGSATPVTREQMEVLTKRKRTLQISIDPARLAFDGREAREEGLAAAAKAMAALKGADAPEVVLLETALHGTRLQLDQVDQEHGYPKGRSAELINKGLGWIVARILDERADRVAGLYCTGGDTEVQVCRALGSPCLEMVDYVFPQADLARLRGRYAGMPIVGKGGLTGSSEAACVIVDRIFKEAGRMS